MSADPTRSAFRWCYHIYLIGLVVLIVLRGYYEWQNSLIDLAFVATGIPFGILFCKARREG